MSQRASANWRSRKPPLRRTNQAVLPQQIQQSGAAAIVPGGHPPDEFAGPPVHHLAADQIALEILALIERRSLAGRNAHFAAVQTLGIGDGVDAAELENQAISTATSGASIRYTTDGSTPSDTVGTVYSGPLAVSATTTLKAVAYASGLTNSSLATAVYRITQPPPPTITSLSPTFGAVGTAVTISGGNFGAPRDRAP